MMFAKYFEYYIIILRGPFLWTRCSDNSVCGNKTVLSPFMVNYSCSS